MYSKCVCSSGVCQRRRRVLQHLHPDGRLPVQQRALLSEVPGKGSNLHCCIRVSTGTTAHVFFFADLVITFLKAYLLKFAENWFIWGYSLS